MTPILENLTTNPNGSVARFATDQIHKPRNHKLEVLHGK